MRRRAADTRPGETAARVAGVDVAPSMLRIARENVPTATFSPTIPDERFDLIVSLVVFQHIPVRFGEALLDDLLDHLTPAGIAALHFTFRRPGSALRRLARAVRGRVPFVHRITQRVRGERPMPYMQMNEYDPERVIASCAATAAPSRASSRRTTAGSKARS